MTTLAIMKARIGSEIRRDDLTSDITDAIGSAIGAYQHNHYFFSESRALIFNTVAGQSIYTATEAPDIANVLKILYAFVMIGTAPYTLTARPIEEVESTNLWGTITGQPIDYSWFSRSIHLTPIPSAVYQARFGAVLIAAAPATDTEANNPWMTHAERLIRCRAKAELYAHVIKDPEKANTYASLASEAQMQIRNKTDGMIAPGPLVVAASGFW